MTSTTELKTLQQHYDDVRPCSRNDSPAFADVFWPVKFYFCEDDTIWPGRWRMNDHKVICSVDPKEFDSGDYTWELYKDYVVFDIFLGQDYVHHYYACPPDKCKRTEGVWSNG